MKDAGDGHPQVYMTYEGLKQAIAYCNRQEIIARNKMLYEGVPEVKDEEWHEVEESSKIIEFNKRRKQA